MRKIIVSQRGDCDFNSVQSAINSIDTNEQTKIYIKNGTYFEKVVLDKPNVTIIGEDKEKTVITYNDSALRLDENQQQLGTFRTATFKVTENAKGFKLKNITVENCAGVGHIVGQGVALYVGCDMAVVKNCRILGRQDTLHTAPHIFEMDDNPDIFNRQYFEDCLISGDVDFIFGGATAIFNKCTIFCRQRHDDYNCYITAACTPEKSKFGYVFLNCIITGDTSDGTVLLGRPWRDYAKTVFINTPFGGKINPKLWIEWGDTDRHKTAFYAQYGCTSSTAMAVKWSRNLTAEQAKEYTIENIFDGWIPEV